MIMLPNTLRATKPPRFESVSVVDIDVERSRPALTARRVVRRGSSLRLGPPRPFATSRRLLADQGSQQIAVSPNGAFLAIRYQSDPQRNDASGSRLDVFRTADARPVLSRSLPGYGGLSWAPNSRELFLPGGSRLALLDVTSGRGTSLATAGFRGSLWPLSRGGVFVRYGEDLFPDWSPGARWLLLRGGASTSIPSDRVRRETLASFVLRESAVPILITARYSPLGDALIADGGYDPETDLTSDFVYSRAGAFSDSRPSCQDDFDRFAWADGSTLVALLNSAPGPPPRMDRVEPHRTTIAFYSRSLKVIRHRPIDIGRVVPRALIYGR